MRKTGRLVAMDAALLVAALTTPIGAQQPAQAPPISPIAVGRFKMDVAVAAPADDGLPGSDIRALAVDRAGTLYAGTANGLALLQAGHWKRMDKVAGPIHALATADSAVWAATDGGLVVVDKTGAPQRTLEYPVGVAGKDVRSLAFGKTSLIATEHGAFREVNGRLEPIEALNRQLGRDRSVRCLAVGGDGRIAAAAAGGLFHSADGEEWRALYPADGNRSWAPRDVRAVVFDSSQRLWFASPQGIGCDTGKGWNLFTGQEGLPYDDFTAAAAGDDAVWFGTKIGAIRRAGNQWNYRQGRAWLPDDEVRSIVVDGEGSTWLATKKGLGKIERRSTTLAEKARFFEDEIDKYHRRTPFEYVLGVGLAKPGDKSTYRQHDSDNDGLWTSMYGAGEAFAYAATKDPKAKERAKKAFEAVRYLSQVTQGGSHPAPKGFPARTILPTSGPNPNESHYTPEKDRAEKRRDPLWKVIVPRWPTSADGKWFWKTDTSSDELDGHYFLYAVYHDLVADSPEEKARVRDVVVAMTDHLIDHDFELIDHDGKPTRWGRFSPTVLNGDVLVNCRGLNSLSLLSYLKVAEHVTGGGKKYVDAYQALIKNHFYATNVLNPKYHFGAGTGNQSDDEMAFMCYYTLLSYEKDPVLLAKYYRSFATYWTLEEPERCPLFTFIFQALYKGGARGRMQSSARATTNHLEEAIDTLKRYPIDRVRWGFKNSHRKDIVLLRGFWGTWGGRKRGHLLNGRVLPIDERFVEHWNHDPWNLDEGGGGTSLADGNSFLLPYYMGLYLGFIQESAN